MIVCTACGHANDSGERFCRSCDTYLEWAGEKVLTAPRPAEETATEPDPDIPAPRQPETEQWRPVSRRTVPVAGPTDLYCGACGTGNAAGRNFCRSCGHELDDVVVVEELLPWWRRLLRWLRGLFRRRTTLAAGERPDRWRNSPEAYSSGRRRRFRMPRLRMPQRISLGRMAIPLAVLSLFGMGIAPVRAKVTNFAFDLYNRARPVVVPTYDAVTPASAEASSAQRAHPAGAAVDRNTATWWAASSGRRPSLTVRFDGVADIAKVAFDNGAAGKDYPFAARAKVVRVSFYDGPRQVLSRDLTLADKPEFQTFDLVAAGANSATVSVRSVYTGQKSADVALREVAFIAKH